MRLRRQDFANDRQHRPIRWRAALALCAAPWLALGAWTAARRLSGAGGLTEQILSWLQPGRGRRATSPRKIPLRGWRDILWRTWREFNKDQIPTVAGGVTFFGLLATFPGLAAFVALYGLFDDVQDAVKHIEALSALAPRDVVVFVGAQMIRVAAVKPSVLSVAFLVSLALSLWSANSGMKALFNGLNVAYGEREKRNYFTRTLWSLTFTIGGLGVVLLALAALIVAPLALPFLKDEGAWLSLLRWPALLAVTTVGLAVVYRYGPSREHARWRWVTWGGAVAAVLWLAASLLFSWWVGGFAHYDRTYGSFAAAAGAMTWSWMTVVIVLFGAELNAEIERQTAVDSTTGPPEPLGLRGAYVADTIGEARR